AGAIDSDFKKKHNTRLWILIAVVIAALLAAVWLGTIIARLDETKPAVGKQNSTNIKVNDSPPVDIVEPEQVIISSSLQARISETEKWFATASDNHYSIQLFVTHIADEEGVKRFLREDTGKLDLDRVYIYETVIDGVDMYSVLYGDFATYQDAQTMLDGLPDSLKQSQPFLRRISALRKDLARNN
ncbi:MAG: SPOR domain-containing protein, partial [Gammaproteobacteria bacterium]|nr:SPOR domain-containing protein [Gammaproteobacteria bacterium]